jgi:hypothetical protein
MHGAYNIKLNKANLVVIIKLGECEVCCQAVGENY